MWKLCLGLIMMTGVEARFSLESADFSNQKQMPAEFTCQGDDISPALKWSGHPKEAKSFVLIMDDPDAPIRTWDHWLIYNIPAATTEIEKDGKMPNGALQGKNSWGKNKYGGPCPPKGNHRYYFRLYALDTMLTLPEGATKQEIFAAISGHILATAELMGLYEKTKNEES